MAIETTAQFRHYIGSLKGRIKLSNKKALGRALGLGRRRLRETAPVDTGEYRSKIMASPVVVRRGYILGEMFFFAPHSQFVVARGYHEGRGRDPSRRSRLKILEEEIPEMIQRFVVEELRKVLK